jgi:selenide,water dikinase
LHPKSLPATMKQLLLLGGGHSHVEVIRRLGLSPPHATRIVLVSPGRHTPYSGMLPGFVAGHYAFDECHIDLERLCGRANVHFHAAEAVAIDPQRKAVMLHDGTSLKYDVVSIDIGSTPPAHAVPGALEHAVHVKPVARFLKAWDAICEAAQHTRRAPRIAVIGGGAGGVELALALHYRLLGARPTQAPIVRIFTDTDAILAGHAARAVRIIARVLAERGITVHRQARATAVEPGRLHTATGASFEADHFIWVTGASAPPWIAESGIGTDAAGFVLVNAQLQSVSHPDVFAAGDVASMSGHRLPKSGVYAVRQGPPLAANLRQALVAGALYTYEPQTSSLSLISTGNRYAVASYRRFAFEGVWVWLWKDRIDRRFVHRYRALSPGNDGPHARS